MIDPFRTTVDCISTIPARRVPALKEALTRATAHERELVALTQTYTARLAAVDADEDRSRTGTTRALRKDLVEALAQIERGVHPAEGTLPDLAVLSGKPGLPETRELIRGLKAELAEWTQRRDHDDDVRLYRLKPGMSHRVDGRVVRAGETVSLSGHSFRAFEDKFELAPVEEPALAQE